MKQTIKLEKIEQGDKQIKLIDGKKKFTFWLTKKDGLPTKSYIQFKQLNPQIGDSIEAEVTETQGEFNGYPVTYRNIMWFYLLPPQPGEKPVEQPKTQTLETIVNKLAERVAKIESFLRSNFEYGNDTAGRNIQDTGRDTQEQGYDGRTESGGQTPRIDSVPF